MPRVQRPYLVGQYIYIPAAVQRGGALQGSVLNAGVYLVPDDKITLAEAHDEAWSGAVCGLAVPSEFVELVREIEAFSDNARADKNRGILTSESFGGYSYSMATTLSGVAASWKEVYASQLNIYRSMFEPRIF